MNVVVIYSDTFRYDHLGFLGRQPVSTPNLDQLARESACFSDFQLCSFPTILNRIEVFTGRCTFPLIEWGPLPFQFPVLAEVFKHHGYATGLIADNPHLMKDGFGFGRGFDFVKNVPGQTDDPFQPASAPMIELPCPIEKLEPRPGRLERYRRNAHWFRQRGTNTTEGVFREALRWLETPRKKFFLWMDAFDPHEPWEAPDRYLAQYPWNPQGDKVIWPRDGRADRYPAADLANMRSLYKAEVSQIDFWVGELLRGLRTQNLLDTTALIFCSDHGYYLGEHGLLGKLRLGRPITLYEEVGHAPFLLRHPGGLSAGKSIGGLCQPPDLFATALDLAGIPGPGWAQGHSVVPRLSGKSAARKFAVGGSHPRKGKVGCLTVWSDEWTLIYVPLGGLAGSELYHRPTDPAQLNNVIAANHPVAQQHLDFLCHWLEELRVPASRQRQLLLGSRFGWLDSAGYRWWRWKNRLGYWRRYRHYAAREA